jgi:hypothetical protein
MQSSASLTFKEDSMTPIDRTELNVDDRNLPLHPMLESFAHFVSMAKPMVEFSADKNCINTALVNNPAFVEGGEEPRNTHARKVFSLYVTEAGEKLGSIGIITRYRNGTAELAYCVDSFRISKSRRRSTQAVSGNIKVAVREAKKAFVSRETGELIELISSQITNNLGGLYNSFKSSMRWQVDNEAELTNLIINAYQAKMAGQPTFSLSSNLSTIRDVKEHSANCEKFIQCDILWKMLKKDVEGHSLLVHKDGSMVMYSYSTKELRKFKSFEELPETVQNKFALFKVLNENDPHGSIGCKFSDEYFYIAK